MVEKKKKDGGFSKRKGGAFERKVAKELSMWMFDGNSNILKRHPTSGADKCIWSGDIIPLAQLPVQWNGNWPFYIETKSGYEKHYPDFMSYRKIEEWFLKACFDSTESKQNQNIILLITQFKYKKPILFTNRYLGNLVDDPLPQSVIPMKYVFNNNNFILWVYVYNYNELLALNFNDLYNLQEING